jgi:hypothetical protein
MTVNMRESKYKATYTYFNVTPHAVNKDHKPCRVLALIVLPLPAVQYRIHLGSSIDRLCFLSLQAVAHCQPIPS